MDWCHGLTQRTEAHPSPSTGRPEVDVSDERAPKVPSQRLPCLTKNFEIIRTSKRKRTYLKVLIDGNTKIGLCAGSTRDNTIWPLRNRDQHGFNDE